MTEALLTVAQAADRRAAADLDRMMGAK